MSRLAGCVVVVLAMLSPAAADTPKYVVDKSELRVPHPVTFDAGTATLKPESNKALDHVKGYLAAKEAVTLLRIEVHSDSMGATESNQRKSEHRALATAYALVDRGVDCKRLLPVGFGESKPIADNRTAAGKAANRRVTFFHAALKGKPIDKQPVDGGGKVAGDPCAPRSELAAD